MTMITSREEQEQAYLCFNYKFHCKFDNQTDNSGINNG